MNKIYRVVFNHATQSWTAVAEIARAKGKGSSTTVGSSSAADQPSTSGHLLRLSLVSSALFLAAQAQAATGTDAPAGVSDADGSTVNYCYYHTDWDTVICGDGSTTNGTASNGVVLGKTAQMTGNSAIAIGNGTLSAVNAVSIGRDAKAANAHDIAIGNNAGLGRGDKGSNFTAKTAFAAGTVYSGGATQTAESISTNNGISLGQNAGTNSTGINNTMIGTAAGEQLFGDNTVTIGTNANNYRVNGFSNGQVNTNNNTVDALSGNTKNAANAVNRSRQSVAIGNNAMTYDDSNIAIGDGAKSLGASSIAMGNGARAGMAYTTVGGATRGDGGSIAIGKNSVAPLEGDLSIGVNVGSRVNQNTNIPITDPTKPNPNGIMQTTKNISVGYDVGGNVYGYTNTVIGTSSGSSIGTAEVPNYANVAIGDQVGRSIRGNNNVNIGYQGGNNITSNSNTSVGSRSGSHVSGANNVTTGTFAGTFVSGNANWAAGKDSGTHVGVLSNANRLDINTGNFVASDGTVLTRRNATNNVAAGEFTGRYVGGSKNIAFGQNAGEYVGHKGTEWGAVSNNNIAMGEQSGRFIEGNYNYASGYQAGSGTAKDATLTRNNSISQGFKANAYTNDSIAIGSNSVAGVQSANGAGKINAIAIGNGAKATGAQSISVGTGNVVSGDNSGAFGDPTTISGTGSYSVGNNNTIATNDTFVVGSNVTKTLDNSVFLGKDAAYTAKGASTDGVEKVSDATVGGITYAGTSFAGQTPVGVVSVGDVGKERRIQNVAAGLINATSTDAINGSQLYMVAKELGEEVQNTYFHTNTGAANQEAGDATTNLGSITSKAGATGTNAVTAGKNATAAGKDAVAVGESATANATQVTSVGYNAGQGSTNAANSTFIGTGAGANSNGTAQGTQLTTAYNTYVGSNAGNRATGVQNTAVGGNNAGAGVTGDANAAFGHASLYNTKGNLNTGLGAYAGQNSTGNSNTSVGDNAGRKVTGNNNTALGSNAGTGTKGSDNVAIGVDAGQSITAAETVSIGKGAKANNDKAVALGSGAVTDVSVDTKEATVNGITYGNFAGSESIATVSVGSKDNERTITNVAAGRISATSTDAINGSQLYMVADKLGTLNTEIANTYFHVNNGSNKDTGDATTNLGRITDAAGAKNVGAVTAGMNAVAETSQSIAIGQGAKAGAADRTGSSNWANIIDPRTKNPFTSEAELLAYYETVKTNPGNTVTRALIGKINNIAIGAGAVAEGGRNISIGENAGVGTADNWNIQNVNIGTEAGQNSKKDYSVAIGYRAGALTEAQQLTQEATLDGARHPSILIGKEAGKGTVAYGTVAMGAEAGKDISDVRSVHNIAIGRNAGQGVSSNDGRNATFGGFGAGANTLMGASAGRNLSGDGNVAIGNLTGQGTIGDNNIMMGHLAGSGSTTDRSIIMGNQTGWSTGTNDRNVLIGNFVNGGQKANVATAVGIGNNTIATGNSSVSIGNQAKATAVNSIAQGTQAVASGENAISIGAGTTFFGLAVQPNTASGAKSVAIGYANNVTGASAIAIGTQNRVTADNAGAIGDPSIVSGEGSYTLGNDNAVGSTSKNVGAFGNNNQIGATANYDANGKLIALNGLADTAAVENSRAVGNKNYINTSNTYVLGSGVGTKDDGTVLGTVENSVYLGNDSTVAAGAAVGTKNLDKEGVAGTTTTAGDTGTVETATVNGVTYGSFAGKTAAGAVSMGSAGLERRVMNVAAGEISATSTDAINGSQLYMVAQGTLDQMPVIYTDTNGNKLIKSPDGNFYPAGTVLDATGKPVDTTIQPVTNVIASMNDGDNIANTPKTLANVAGSLTPTYNKGDMTIGTDGKPTDTAAGGPTILQTGPKAEDAAKIYNNAATVGDVLNAGWNLQGNGSAQDFVKPYDTVNFADGTGTTVDVTTDDGKTSTIKVNVDAQSTVESAQTPVVYTNKEGDKLIKGDDGKFYPADSVKIGDNYYPAGTTEDENGNPVDANGDTVTALTPTGTGDIIASMNNGDNSTTAPMTLTNIASNLPNTYNKDAYNTADAPVTTSQALPDNLNVNNAATVGDVLNAGWNLQGNGTAKDFVKPYDTVNFADGTGTTVDVSTDEDGKVSTIKVNVDAQAVTNNSQLPVVYTDKDGKQVYPIVDEDGNVTYNTQPDGKGDVVAKGDVITSINGPEGTTTPTTLTNVASNLPNTYNNDAYNTGDAPVTTEQALPVDEQGNPTLNVNNAATVGDILNAGWNLQGNGTAKDFVKPYDTVNFADGTGTTVDVSTDEEGKVSTIKVNVDAQTVTNDSQLPVVYTDKNGNQVYPIVDDQGNVTYNTQPDGKGDTVDKGDVITSINGPDGTTTPTTLTNVASNLPNTYNTDVYNTTNQPVTVSQALPTGLNVNNAATVGDILNAGWNLQGNGVAKDFVKPYDTVNFVNGNATTATVETAADGKSSTVKYDVQVDGNTIKVVDGKLTAAADSNTVTGVTAGDNITVTSTTDASGNPTYTVATKKDVTFDSVTINNGPTINADGINMNGDKITNVADGDISPTSKDAVNGSQLYSAVNNINSNIAASKEEVTSNDKSVTVTTTKNASGSNVFDLSVNTDGTTITKNAGGALTVNTTPLTNNTDGSVNTPAAPNAIATAGDVANAINNSGFTLTAQGSNGSLVKPGSTVDMNNTDGNIVISKSASDNKVTYNLAKDIKVDSVTTGNTVVNNSGVTINNADPAKTVSLTENGLNNGGNRITNVAPGKDGTDAVNVNQLNQVNNNVVNLNNKVNRVDRDLRGGIAGANAAAALPQAYIPGKSMVAAAAGTYRGQSALAVGYSRISDNGKIILKLQGNTNTRGDIGGAIGVGYQW